MLLEPQPQRRRDAPQNYPVFVTTTDIAEYARVQQQQPDDEEQVPQVFNEEQQQQPDPEVIQARQVRLEQAAEVDRQNQLRYDPRHQQIMRAPRNIDGGLLNAGDRQLEASNPEHPGLPNDQATRNASGIASPRYVPVNQGRVMSLDVVDDGTFVEANNGGPQMSNQDAGSEESKEPLVERDLDNLTSNQHMSASPDRETRRRDRSIAGRAQRAKASNLLNRLGNV